MKRPAAPAKIAVSVIHAKDVFMVFRKRYVYIWEWGEWESVRWNPEDVMMQRLDIFRTILSF